MAMFDGSDRAQDRLAARRALYLILGLGATLVILIAMVIVYYNGYGY